MKKSFLLMGLAVAALSFTNCNKQEVEIPAAGDPFAIQLTSVEETRTTNDGMATKWVEGDALSVFYATAGSTSFSANNQFSITNAEANLATADITLADGTYDWYAFYPYNSYFTSPANNNDDPGRTYIGSRSDRSQTQTGYNNMDHVAGSDVPLYGLAKNVASGDVPQIQMKHIASVIEIAVTNQSGSVITINGAEFSAPEGTDIIGQYNISFDKDEPTIKKYLTYQSNTASLSVNNGTALANGSTAKLYLVVKPFTASSLTLKINTDKGNQEKSISLSTPATFSAGHIKTLNFAVTSTSAEKGTEANPYTASEASAAASALSDGDQILNVYVKGFVAKIDEISTSHGNATYYIADNAALNGTWFEIFRGYYLNGANFTSTDQLGVGDEVVVKGTIINYKGNTPEMSQGSQLVSIVKSTVQPSQVFSWDLSTNSYSSASEEKVEWTGSVASMVVDKNNAQTNANNYLGGDANNRTSSRFYRGSTVTITPKSGVTIKSISFSATSGDYASAFASSTWTNATTSMPTTTVVKVTPTNGASSIIVDITGTCGFKTVTIEY